MHRQLAIFSLAVALQLSATAASAAVITSARDTIATISFANSAFENAQLRIDATQTIAAGSKGTKVVSFDAAPSLKSYELSSQGAASVTLNSFTPPSSFDLAVSANGAGSWKIVEHFAATPFDGDGPLYHYSNQNDYYVPFLNNDLPALELFLQVGGLVDDGGSFGIGFTIAGNFSTTGGLASTSGQYFLAGLDPDWVIDTPFVYDSVADVTRFHATNPAYEGMDSDHPSPFLDVYFFGRANVSDVPEPCSWAMMISGFGLVGAVMRRGNPVNKQTISA